MQILMHDMTVITYAILNRLTILGLVMYLVDYRDWRAPCMTKLHEHTIGYLVILSGCILLEILILRVSSRGSITDVSARKGIEVLLYLRLVLLVVELVWMIYGVLWLSQNYTFCYTLSYFSKNAILGITITNLFVITSVIITLICSFDWEGRAFVSQTKRRRSSIEVRSQPGRRGSRSDFQSAWGHRCLILSCFLNARDRHHGSLVQVVNMLSEMFDNTADDLVASDIIAGLILLRRLQTLRRDIIVSQKSNDIYTSLSGIGITPTTKFLDTNDPLEVDEIKELIHFMQYSMASYGWPVAAMASSRPSSSTQPRNRHEPSCCLCPLFSCSMCKCQKPKCCPTHPSSRQETTQAQRQDYSNFNQSNQSNHHRKKRWNSTATTVGDNCCKCNQRAFDRLSSSIDCELIHAKYSARVGEPSFSVIVDHGKRCVVVCIRGTLSLEDLITDLNAVSEVLPLNPLKTSWTGHRGMVFAAEFVKQELFSRELLKRAFGHRVDRGTPSYQLIFVGHSLGAGVACILAVLLRDLYPRLHCYAFSPPGGLFSRPVVEFSRSFITTVILGKDAVPRLGLHSIQVLKRDLITAISSSKRPKWKIIGYSCCFSSSSFLTKFNKRSKKNEKHARVGANRSSHQTNNNTSSSTNNNLIETRDTEERVPAQETKFEEPREDVSSESTRLHNLSQVTCDVGDEVDTEIREAIQFWDGRRRNEVLHSLRQPPSLVTQSRAEEDGASSRLLPPIPSKLSKKQQRQEDPEAGPSDVKIEVNRRDDDILLLPPGNIIHIVRSHPSRNGSKHTSKSSSSSKKDVIYQALRVNNDELDEVLISPVMIHDHLPFNILAALEGLLTRSAPPKPDRLPSFVEPSAYHFDGSAGAAFAYQTAVANYDKRTPPSGPLPPPPLTSIPDSTVVSDQPQPQHLYASIGTASSSNNINNMSRQHQPQEGNNFTHRTPTPTDTLIDTLSVTSKLLIETSFTDLRPCSTMTDASYYGSRSGGSYGRRSLMNGYNNYYCNGSTAGRSNIIYNNRPSFLSALRHHRKHDLFSHDWMRTAPLASPENSCLTDASSLMARNLKETMTREDRRHEGVNRSRQEQSVKSSDDRIRTLEEGSRRRRSEDVCDQRRLASTDDRGSRLSLQELIDVFSDCSDSRSLQDMVEEAKRVITPTQSASHV